MIKISKNFCIQFFFFALFLIFSFISLNACDIGGEITKRYTWTFKNSASEIDYIIVTPKDSEDDTPFTLYYGQSHDVTWVGVYRGGYSWQTFWPKSYSWINGSEAKQYDSSKQIVFYTGYKSTSGTPTKNPCTACYGTGKGDIKYPPAYGGTRYYMDSNQHCSKYPYCTERLIHYHDICRYCNGTGKR